MTYIPLIDAPDGTVVHGSDEAPPPSGPVEGVDLSDGNTRSHESYDWQAVRDAGMRFVILKASQGKSYKNPDFADAWRGIRALGGTPRLAVGAYHFLNSPSGKNYEDAAPSTIEEQAENYIEALAAVGSLARGDLPIALDLETKVLECIIDDFASLGTRPHPYGEGDVCDWIAAWFDYVYARVGGLKPLLYVSQRGFNKLVDHAVRHGRVGDPYGALCQCDLWIVDYRPTDEPEWPRDAWSSFRIRQFTSAGGPVPGIPDHVKDGRHKLDRNRFNGTEAMFRAWVADIRSVDEPPTRWGAAAGAEEAP